MDNNLLINIAIQLIGITISITGLVTVFLTSQTNVLLKRHFLPFFAFLLLYVLNNLLYFIYHDHLGTLFRYGTYVSIFLRYLIPFLLIYVILNYILQALKPAYSKRLKTFGDVLLIIHVSSLILSQFTNSFYYIDEMNGFHRGPLSHFPYLICLLLMSAILLIIFRNRKRIRKTERQAVYFYLIFPMICLIIQMYVISGIYIFALSSVIAGFLIYLLIMLDQTERYHRKEVENAQIKSNLLLAQMQPHFIFNSLMSIEDLCYTDPETAAASIEDFAMYLRKNMEIMSKSEMVDIAKEKEFIDEYIKLEMADPERKFEVEYDLQETDFKIPTLTLQPLVENAINYGALSRNDGKGKVSISSFRQGDMIIIEVSDNGNKEVSRTEGQKKHWGIAISNIAERLAHYCDGRLEIIDQDEGTCVRISIRDKKKAD